MACGGVEGGEGKVMAGNEEAATTTEGGRPETAAAQQGTESEKWKRVVDLVQAAFW